MSRQTKPKQLLALFDDETLLGKTVDRLEGLVPLENILILTNAVQEAAVRETLPRLPAENVIAEPAKRDTAPAIGLGVALVAARDPEASMVVLPADHLIEDTGAFRQLLGGALDVAGSSEALLTIGIPPTWPCPSYGYVQRGPEVSVPGLENHPPVFEVARFTEKPDPETAARFS